MLPVLIDTFLTDAPKLLKQMRQAAEQGDANTLQRAARTLKSNAKNFGAMALADMCQHVEICAKRNIIEEKERFFENIQEEFIRIHATLTRIKDDGHWFSIIESCLLPSARHDAN